MMSLYLTKHKVIKVYGGSESVSPCIPKFALVNPWCPKVGETKQKPEWALQPLFTVFHYENLNHNFKIVKPLA